MRFALALTLICFLFGTAVSWAAEGHDGEKKAEPAKEDVATLGAPRAPSVDMPTLVAPVIINGEMHHYVYFSVTLKLVDDNHKTELLDKIPYLQDAFLREVHGASIARDMSA